MTRLSVALTSLVLALAAPASAEWQFSSGASPNAFIQTDNMTLELQCDRIRFAPAGFEDSQDIAEKQGLAIRFLKDGATEVASFQAGDVNSSIRIVDNFPVEIEFLDPEDYTFVLEQTAANAVLNLSMIDQDVSYGIFDLKGSAAAIRSLVNTCTASASARTEEPASLVYCGGNDRERTVQYVIYDDSTDDWDAYVTVDGQSVRAMTAYSYFGNSQPPEGFVVALLAEDRSEYLVFDIGDRSWIESGDSQYDRCD